VLDRLAANDRRIDPATEWVLQVFDWTGADHLHAHWTHASPGLFDEIERRGKRVSFWTVNDLDLITALTARPQTANLVTDFPHLVFAEWAGVWR
jgi:hypothetical protein